MRKFSDEKGNKIQWLPILDGEKNGSGLACGWWENSRALNKTGKLHNSLGRKVKSSVLEMFKEEYSVFHKRNKTKAQWKRRGKNSQRKRIQRKDRRLITDLSSY